MEKGQLIRMESYCNPERHYIYEVVEAYDNGTVKIYNGFYFSIVNSTEYSVVESLNVTSEQAYFLGVGE